ncbi:flagellar transcriptional regulator FlhD [Methylomonas sp. MS20]|nr:flagellar transcriptional regulator FlhD [Methylomonas sp. MV1]MDT4332696.1 flagellar transcriptional regulator FlhD [Methylomonas sp. MV1]
MSSITIQGLGNTEMIFNYLNLIGVPKKAHSTTASNAGSRSESREVSKSCNGFMSMFRVSAFIRRSKSKKKTLRPLINSSSNAELSRLPEVCDPKQVTLRTGLFCFDLLAYRQQPLINYEASMSTLDEDLSRLNFEYLMLARECARSNPAETAWRFGLDKNHIEKLADMTLEQLRDQAESSRAVIRLLPIFVPNGVSMGAYVDLLQPLVSERSDENSAI